MSNALMKPANQSAGAMDIATSRESADSQTQMIAAKHYPRDEDAASLRILRACERRGLAESAVYSYKKGDGVIEGASIRLAEVIAQNWGNLDCGWRVLRATETESEVQAHAWDLETNTRKVIVFNVPHFRQTRTGGYLLKDPREIYELQANNAARRIRACILSLIPGDITESAVAACEATMSKAIGKGLPERIKDIVEMFAGPGMLVTESMLEARLQTKRAAWTAAQVGQMGKLFVAIRDGFVNREDIPEFNVGQASQVQTEDTDTRHAEAVKPEPKTKEETPVVIFSPDEHAAEIGALKQRGLLATEALANDVDAQMEFSTIWDQISDVKNVTALKAIGGDIKKTGERFGDSLATMRDWYSWRMRELTGKIKVAK